VEQRLAWVARSRKSCGESAPQERQYRGDVGYGGRVLTREEVP
jgi:hypothetical protein